MKFIKSAWLEIIFSILIIIVIVLSITNSVHTIKIENPKILNQSTIQLGTVRFSEYINEIKKLDDCTTVITVKDIQGYFTTPEMIEGLKTLGFDQADILSEQEYHSFIGIYSGKNVIYQCVGGDEAITFGQYINNHYVYAKSATWSSGNTGDIYIDDVQYAVNNRGFNIVTIDNVNNELIDSIAYDVYIENIPVYRLVNNEVTYIAPAEEGFVYE